MNHHPSKMNFAVKKKARGFSSMGAGFVDQMETIKMEERLQLMKRTMEMEREERKNRGGQFWKSGQKGKLTTYANTVLQSKLSNKKVGKVKMLTEEQLNLPNRNEAQSLSKKLSDISNTTTGNFKATKSNVRLCGQCESNGAALCCIQCTEVYCTACFSAYHKKGALRKHRSISLEVSSTPRSKPPSHDKRLFDLALYSMAAETTSQQSDSPSPPSVASGVTKTDEDEAAAMSTLMEGNYNEAESAASFQQALVAWRTSTQSPATAAGAAATVSLPIEAAPPPPSVAPHVKQIPSSQLKPKMIEGIDSGTSTRETTSLASLMDKNQNHTLSYAERLLVKKNRRTPINWEKKDPHDVTDPSESKDNPEQIRTEETPIPGRLSADEPVTFSSLYRLVSEESKEFDQSSPLEEEELLAITFENIQDELPEEPQVSNSPTVNFPPPSSISITPVVESFPERCPSSSASQLYEKVKIKSASSRQSEKKTPVHTPRKRRSRRSSSVLQATNLTTVPSDGLHMVCQLAKSQHRYNDGQQPSILMAGLSSEAIGDTGEVIPSGRDSPPLKSKAGVSRPPTTVRVSYTFYKMSPRSWHPEESIGVSLSGYLFQRSGLEGTEPESDPTSSLEIQRESASDSPRNTIGTASPALDKLAIAEDTKGDEEQASGNLSAKSSDNQDLPEEGRSPTTSPPGGTTVDTPRTMMELNHILAHYNNNALSDQADRYDAMPPPLSAMEGTVSPILTASTTPGYFSRSKTMSPISTIYATNKGSPIYSARSTPRTKSTPPDLAIEKHEDDFDKYFHSVKHSPRCKTVSPILLEINPEENVSPARSLRASVTSLHSVKDIQRDQMESPIFTMKDPPENPSDTPIRSLRNTPRSNTMPSIPIIKERYLTRSVTPTGSIKSTPRSKTMSTIQILQETQKRCDTLVYSVKGTPRYESPSPVPTVLETQLKRSDTPSLTKIDTEESIFGTISNISENISETSVDSLRCSASSKTASSIATMIEFQENGSAASVESLRGTPRNKSESPISTIIDTQESASDTPAPSVSTTTFEIPTISEKQPNSTTTPVPSTIDTPSQKSDVTTIISPAKGSPMTNLEENSPEETFEYNAKVYQMLVNKELKCGTPDPTDHIVPLFPTATDQNRNTFNLNEPSETTSATTETDLTSSDCIPITSGSGTPQCSSPTCSSDNDSDTPVDSGEKLPIRDKLATPFYMCNAELYDDAVQSPVQCLDFTPSHASSKLKKSSTSPTKKYIIRRPPKIPDGTKQQESNSQKDDDILQPEGESASSPTLSVLEMKRIHFKQSNNGQNVVSPKIEQSNLIPDLSRSSQSLIENVECSVDCSVDEEEDPESVFSNLTKMSVDSLEGEGEEPSDSLAFIGEEFLMSDDLQAEIDEMEEQIAEEIKVKALK